MNDDRPPAPTILHATTIARRQNGRWRGVMIRGPSGAGKSDLALRALAAGWRLAADDRTLVWISGGRLFGCAPPRLQDLIEVRGVEIARAFSLRMVELALVAECATDRAQALRLPDPRTVEVLGSTLPCLELFACDASALAKLTLALEGSGASL